MCLGYLGYFTLGNYIHLQKRFDSIKAIVWVAIFALSVVVIAFLTRYCTGGEVPLTKYFDYVTPLVAMSSVGVFMLVKKIRVESWLGKTMDWLLKYTRKELFEIYLIHLFWIDLIPHIDVVDRIVHSNVYLCILIMSIIIFLLTLFSIKLIRIVPLINKLV